MTMRVVTGKRTIVSGPKLGQHLGISATYVARLVTDGVIERRPDGRFDQDACRLAYIKWLRDPARRAARAEAAGEYQRMRSRDLQLRVAVREGQLIELEEVLPFVENMIGLFRSELTALPARVTRDLQFRQTIETAINDILGRLADMAEERARALLNSELTP